MAFGTEMIRGRIMIVEVVAGCHNQLGTADLLNARILIKVVILAIQRENVDLVAVERNACVLTMVEPHDKSPRCWSHH